MKKIVVFASVFMAVLISANSYATSSTDKTAIHPNDPFYNTQRELTAHFDKVFRQLMGDSFMTPRMAFKGFSHPRADVYETEDKIQVSIDIPGIDKNDVEVEVFDSYISLKYEKEKTEKSEGKNYHLTERRYGNFKRVIPIPDGADVEKASADYKQGVLYINIPKLESAKPKSKKLKL